MEIIIVLVMVVLALVSQGWLDNAYRKQLRFPTSKAITGAQAAQNFLHSKGVYDVKIVRISGVLSDHYNPTTKTIGLSADIYNGTSIASVGIACHEAGHAIQHAEEYSFIALRNKLLPTVNIANKFSWIIIVVGLLLSMANLFYIGIALFGVIALFQLVTLPIEFNASSRALEYLNGAVLYEDEVPGARQVLSAAAFTYVVALLSSLLQIIRLVLIFSSRDRD